MGMTEQMAIRELEANIDLPFGVSVSDEASKMAIQALEERQQYRAIGTVEELQALKEKSVAKKPVLVKRGFVQFYPCPNPNCSNPNKYMQVYPKQKYCDECGQHLDWE